MNTQRLAQLASASRRTAELIEERLAISEVLRAIANSPNDLQPIFDAILDSATRRNSDVAARERKWKP